MRVFLLFAFLLMFFTVLSYSVDISSCTNISYPGYYRLIADVSGSGSYCIGIESSNITFDLNGHSVSCDGCSAIEINPSTVIVNVTVLNGDIESSDIGIYAYESSFDVFNVSITNIDTDGIYLDTLDGNVVNLINISVSGAQNGVYLDSPYESNISLIDFIISDFDYEGVKMDMAEESFISLTNGIIMNGGNGIGSYDSYTYNFNISNVSITSMDDSCVYLDWSESMSLNINDLDLTSCVYGIDFENCDLIDVKGSNVFITNVDKGIFVDSLLEHNNITFTNLNINSNNVGFDVSNEDGDIEYDSINLVINNSTIYSNEIGIKLINNIPIFLLLNNSQINATDECFYSNTTKPHYIISNSSFYSNTMAIYLPYEINVGNTKYYADLPGIVFKDSVVNGKPALFTSNPSDIPNGAGFPHFVNASLYGYIGLINIQDFYVNGELPSNVDRGLLLWNCSNGVVEVSSPYSFDKAVLMINSTNITVNNSNISNLYIRDLVDEIKIVDSYFSGSDTLLMVYSDDIVKNILLVNNSFEGTNAVAEDGPLAVYIAAYNLENVSVEGNNISHVGCGIYTDSWIAKSVNVVSNNVRDTHVGIYSSLRVVGDPSDESESNKISGNKVWDSEVGIRLIHTNNEWVGGGSQPFCKVTSNTIENVSDGFQIVGGEYVLISNNSVKNAEKCVNMGFVEVLDYKSDYYFQSLPVHYVMFANLSCENIQDICFFSNVTDSWSPSSEIHVFDSNCSGADKAIDILEVENISVVNSKFEGLNNGVEIGRWIFSSLDIGNIRSTYINFTNVVLESRNGYAFFVDRNNPWLNFLTARFWVELINVSVINPSGARTTFTTFDFVPLKNNVTAFNISPTPFSNTPSNLVSLGDKRLDIVLPYELNITRLTFYWDDSELGGVNESSIQLWRNHGGTWEVPGEIQELDTVNNRLTAFNITNASIYGLYGQGTVIIPPSPGGIKPTELSIEVICNEN